MKKRVTSLHNLLNYQRFQNIYRLWYSYIKNYVSALVMLRLYNLKSALFQRLELVLNKLFFNSEHLHTLEISQLPLYAVHRDQG